jgi:hypothetical protein
MQLATEANMLQEISIRRAMEYLWNETSGLIFSAYFRKKDGTMRQMVCRVGVKAHLKGGKRPYSIRTLLPVFDMHLAKRVEDPAKAYRNVNLATLASFNALGERFLITF